MSASEGDSKSGGALKVSARPVLIKKSALSSPESVQVISVSSGSEAE